MDETFLLLLWLGLASGVLPLDRFDCSRCTKGSTLLQHHHRVFQLDQSLYLANGTQLQLVRDNYTRKLNISTLFGNDTSLVHILGVMDFGTRLEKSSLKNRVLLFGLTGDPGTNGSSGQVAHYEAYERVRQWEYRRLGQVDTDQVYADSGRVPLSGLQSVVFVGDKHFSLVSYESQDSLSVVSLSGSHSGWNVSSPGVASKGFFLLHSWLCLVGGQGWGVVVTVPLELVPSPNPVRHAYYSEQVFQCRCGKGEPPTVTGLSRMFRRLLQTDWPSEASRAQPGGSKAEPALWANINFIVIILVYLILALPILFAPFIHTKPNPTCAITSFSKEMSNLPVKAIMLDDFSYCLPASVCTLNNYVPVSGHPDRPAVCPPSSSASSRVKQRSFQPKAQNKSATARSKSNKSKWTTLE